MLTVDQDCIVAVEQAAALSSEDLEAGNTAAAAAAAAAAFGDGGDSGSEMSFSSGEGGISGDDSEDELSSEMEERHLGGLGCVMDHARCACDTAAVDGSCFSAASGGILIDDTHNQQLNNSVNTVLVDVCNVC
jgi:hypothetical protein